MNKEKDTRLNWIKYYQSTKNLGLTCKRCGISRPTLRKWLQRYRQSGEIGLTGQSQKPHHSPHQKVYADQEQKILFLRKENNLGARRIQNELNYKFKISLSLAMIHKVLKKHQVQPLRHPKREKMVHRHSRPIPGDRVQMDTCKIAPGIYQFTAIDDCSRYQVMVTSSHIFVSPGTQLITQFRSGEFELLDKEHQFGTDKRSGIFFI